MKKIKIGFDNIQKKDVYKILYNPDETPAMQLFNTEDVIKGNPSSNIAIGFVYTWKDDSPPQDVREFFQRISNYAFITGLWKTTNGARYVFANILANPNVNKLVLLVFDQKDNGHLLSDALVNFWKNGCDDDGTIIDSKAPNPKFEQVSEDALDRIKKQMDLVVIRDIDTKKADATKKVEATIKALFQEPDSACGVPKGVEFYSDIGLKKLYDDGARFDEPYVLDLTKAAKKVEYIEKYSRLPLGQTVHADNLQEALEMVTAFVYEHGVMFKDQRGIITMESRSFSVTIKDVLKNIPKGFSDAYLKKYVGEFMEGKGQLDEFAYTYHDRIFNKWGNQVTKAIEVLKKDKNTRRCIISLWDPETDLSMANPPCLNFLWFVVRSDVLEMHTVYRSQHLATVTKSGKMMKGEGAFVPNLFALGTLHEHIAEKIGIRRGPIVLTDFSGHLYMSDV